MIDIRFKQRTTNPNFSRVPAVLDQLDPSVGYGDWIRILMAIFHESEGSEDGFELADSWSSKGTNYMGTKDVRAKWRGLRHDVTKPVTIGTLIWMANRS